MHSIAGKLIIGLKAICCAFVSPDVWFSDPKDKFIPNKMIYVKKKQPCILESDKFEVFSYLFWGLQPCLCAKLWYNEQTPNWVQYEHYSSRLMY